MPSEGVDKTLVSAPAVIPPVLTPGTVFADRYRVIRHMGSGSLCAAYLVKDEKGGEERVLKVLRPRKSTTAAFMDDFQFLAKSVARYWHPGIARVFDTGLVGNEAFYVMERVEGQPLRAWMLERFTFEGRVFPGLEILKKLIAVFQVIHEHGCYGVLKPENVFLHKSRGPVVMDFGVPGFLNPRDFEFNAHARRNLPYMGPELWQDWSNLVPQSDVFSLGAILYEILVGRPPSWPLKVLPSEASTLFNKNVNQIVLKAMAANPRERYPTLESFSAAVEQLEKSLQVAGKEQERAALEEGSATISVAREIESDAKTAEMDAESKRGTQAIERARGTHAVERETQPSERDTQAIEKISEAGDRGTQALERDAQAIEVETRIVGKGNKVTDKLPEITKELPSEKTNWAEGTETLAAITEHLTGEKPKEDGEEEIEPVPAMIWILLGVLAAVSCILGLMMGWVR